MTHDEDMAVAEALLRALDGAPQGLCSDEIVALLVPFGFSEVATSRLLMNLWERDLVERRFVRRNA